MSWNRQAQKPIYRALHEGDLDELRRLLKEYPDNLRYEDGRECWLHDAAQEGRLPVVRMLVEEFGINPDEVDSDLFYFPNTALSVAAANGYLDIVRWLLDHGATLNFQVEGEIGCPALRGAATSGHLDVVKVLVERGAYLHNALNDMNPMTLASFYGHLDVAKYLHSLGAKHMCELTPRDYSAAHKLLAESLTNERGPVADWSAEIPGDPLVTIHTIPANKKWPTRTLFTLGLSDNNLPWRSVRLFQFQELRLPLSRKWRFTAKALNDPKWNWPVEWLKRLSAQLRSGDEWPEPPALFMNGDPPKPLARGTRLSGWLCLKSLRGDGVDTSDNRSITWHDLYSIYPEEAAFAREHGHQALALRFEERGVPLYVDPRRENVCA